MGATSPSLAPLALAGPASLMSFDKIHKTDTDRLTYMTSLSFNPFFPLSTRRAGLCRGARPLFPVKAILSGFPTESFCVSQIKIIGSGEEKAKKRRLAPHLRRREESASRGQSEWVTHMKARVQAGSPVSRGEFFREKHTKHALSWSHTET